MKLVLLSAALALAGCATPTEPAARPIAPYLDAHQHLVSPAFAPIAKLPERDARKLIAELDAAGIDKAIVLSVGYSFADERKALSSPDERTRAENDWTAQQVQGSNGRLIGFCSANPLRDAALAELERCLKLPGMVGIKQHLGNAGVTLRNPEHLQRMRQLFALAQRLRAPILIHMRARGGTNYGAEDARLFIDHLLSGAPDVSVIVAHLGSAGPGYGGADEVMAVFGEAAKRRDRRLRNVYFDAATNVTEETSPEEAALIAGRLREVGVGRVLYGSDLSPPGGSIARGWDIFRTRLPLTAAELRTIARNRPKLD
jgi:predicted TIM-barrel fold metal-dependent hydrolase